MVTVLRRTHDSEIVVNQDVYQFEATSSRDFLIAFIMLPSCNASGVG